MIKTILFVTHKPRQCGVYEFGKKIYLAICGSEHYKFIKAECESLSELESAVKEYNPAVIIYNYHPSVMPWVSTKLCKGVYRNNIARIKAVQIGIIHEVTQAVANDATGYRNRWILGPSGKLLNSLFQYYIAADSTLLLKNPLVYKTGRLIPEYNKTVTAPLLTTIGSFGFGTPGKGFDLIVKKTQEEFDSAVIRLNIPAADFGDKDGGNARLIAEQCRNLITKPGIKIEISHNFMSDDEVLDFLAANTVNVFLYNNKGGRGISSATDMALAVKRPVALSDSSMFRHILNDNPGFCLEHASLKEIIEKGFAPLEKYLTEWNGAHMKWEFERILNSVFNRQGEGKGPRKGIKRTFISFWKRVFSVPENSFTWLRNTDTAVADSLLANAPQNYQEVRLSDNDKLNRILDDKARELYRPAVEKLFELAPATMAKKISRANVQQAFVFDTVFRLIKKFNNPKLLCVGSYEDTAAMGLQKSGFPVESIDPMINYYLQEFVSRPSTEKNTYDIIFSTSVIEHDPDDKPFIECVEQLLAPGGYAVITCDYKDGWRPGMPKPPEDARFYTKYDLENRLLSYIPSCKLVDNPEWDCPNPDFNYLGKYQYTFAAFVIQKAVN